MISVRVIVTPAFRKQLYTQLETVKLITLRKSVETYCHRILTVPRPR